MTHSGSSRFKVIAALITTLALEGAMLVVFIAIFTETMGLASNQYLCDLPAVGGLFCAIDEDMTAAHLLAFLLAVFSVSVPLMIWSVVLSENIHEDPRGWLASPINKVKAGVAALVYAAVVLLEVVNLYTLIAQETAPNPFGKQGQTDPLMDILSQNQGLGVFVALLIVLVNAVLALLTVCASRSIQQKG